MRIAAVVGLALLVAGCPEPEEVELVDVVVEPQEVVLAAGRTVTLVATGIWSDDSRTNLADQVTWIGSAPEIASVSATDQGGLVSAISEGDAVVTATMDLYAVSTQVTVLTAEVDTITVFPMDLALPVGASGDLAAVAVLSDGSSADLTAVVAWGASDPAVVQLLPEHPGRVLAVGEGIADVSATVGEVVGAATVDVRATELLSLRIEPSEPRMPLGTSLLLIAEGTWSDGTVADASESSTWTSSDPSHVLLEGSVATAAGTGGAILQATVGGVSTTTVATVVAPVFEGLSIEPLDPEISLGLSFDATATATLTDGTTEEVTDMVLWSSDDPTVARASNDLGLEGRVLAVGEGSATVGATLDGLAAESDVTVTPAGLVEVSVDPAFAQTPLGVEAAFTVAGEYTDGTFSDLTDSAVWTSSDPSVAIFSPLAGDEGVVIPMDTGTTDVSAQVGDAVSSATLEILPAALDSLAVTPVGVVAAVGEVVEYSANGTFSDGGVTDLTLDVFWGSSAPGFVVVDNLSGSEGHATALGEGVATILATLDSVTGSSVVEVVPAALTVLVIEPASPAVSVGVSVALEAEGELTDGSFADLTAEVTWSSDDPTVVVTSNDVGIEGQVTGIAPGEATVTATLDDVSTSVVVVVSAP